MTRALVTGSAGFVAGNFLRYALANTDWSFVGLDRLDTAASLESYIPLFEHYPTRFESVWHDLRAEINPANHPKLGCHFDYVVHFAAGSHVDRSVRDPIGFLEDNVLGTAYLLDFLRWQKLPQKILYFSCYDEETRTLTTQGLKRYDELREGDIVFGVGEDGTLVEQPVKRVLVQDYEGDMVHFDGPRVDLLVTPNHRMYGNVRGDDAMLVEQADFTETRKYEAAIALPRPKPWLGAPLKTINVPGIGDLEAGTLLYLCGLFIGDGFVADQIKTVASKSGLSRAERMTAARDATTGRMVSTGKIGARETVSMVSRRIFFDIPTKDPARARLTASLEALGISYSEHSGKSGEHVYVGSGAWSDFFKQFGHGAHNKRIPRWILNLDACLLRRLFDGLIDSDGYWQATPQYTTVSSGLVGDMCELALKLGMSPKIDTHPPSEQKFRGRTIRGGTSYYMYFSSERMPLLSRRNASRKKYSGKIWCVTVPTKNLVVERNGRLAVCGNTDEVFGPADHGENFDEYSAHTPNNPYAASKAAAEAIIPAWANTYGLPLVVSHCTNVYGPRQHPEKFIPLATKLIRDGSVVQIHARNGVPSSRYYVHVDDVSRAVLTILDRGGIWGGPRTGKYNISGSEELSNLDVAERIAKLLGKKLHMELVDFVPNRPRHDMAYRVDSTRLEALGWAPQVAFDEGLAELVKP
jgi:dTDP-D-glucose 4,6-dehydratase